MLAISRISLKIRAVAINRFNTVVIINEYFNPVRGILRTLYRCLDNGVPNGITLKAIFEFSLKLIFKIVP